MNLALKANTKMNRMTLFLVTALLLVSSTFAAEDVPEIASRDYQVHGISIGDSYETVINQLGTPHKEIVDTAPDADGKSIYLHYDGISLDINENEVLNIEITKAGHPVKGIEVGDSIVKVFKVLGKNDVQQRAKKRLSYVVRAANGVLTDAYLLIYIENEQVAEIIFWFNYT
jgi:hypothetical protein